MLYRRGYADLYSVQRSGMIHLLHPSRVSCQQYTANGELRRTRYRDMNCSIDGTSSPTSFSMVLYCDSNRVHAGEYLFGRPAQRRVARRGVWNRRHSLRCRYRVSHVRAFQVLQGDNDPKERRQHSILFAFSICRVEPDLFVKVERRGHDGGRKEQAWALRCRHRAMCRAHLLESPKPQHTGVT